jgi:hypothetical protein
MIDINAPVSDLWPNAWKREKLINADYKLTFKKIRKIYYCVAIKDDLIFESKAKTPRQVLDTIYKAVFDATHDRRLCK